MKRTARHTLLLSSLLAGLLGPLSAAPPCAHAQEVPLLHHMVVDTHSGAWLATHHVEEHGIRTDECALTYLMKAGDNPLALHATQKGLTIRSYNAQWRLMPRVIGPRTHTGLHSHLTIPHTQGVMTLAAGDFHATYTLHATTPHLLVGQLTSLQMEHLLDALEDNHTAYLSFGADASKTSKPPTKTSDANTSDVMIPLRPTHYHPAPSGEGTQEALEAFRTCVNHAGLADLAMLPKVRSPFGE